MPSGIGKYRVSIPKRVSVVLRPFTHCSNHCLQFVSIPKRVSVVLRPPDAGRVSVITLVSIPKRVSVVLRPYEIDTFSNAARF